MEKTAKFEKLLKNSVDWYLLCQWMGKILFGFYIDWKIKKKITEYFSWNCIIFRVCTQFEGLRETVGWRIKESVDSTFFTIDFPKSHFALMQDLWEYNI